MDFSVPITVTATSHEFTFGSFQNHSEAVAQILDITVRDAPNASVYYQSESNVTETFSIAAQYCIPSNSTPKAVQVLTHGVGFDKKYWSRGGPDSQYNYVRFATDAGYATLAWDRLGCGNSSKPDPYSIVQGEIEVAVLVGLTEKLRNGTILGSIEKPETVVHVGHSYGSQVMHGFAAQAPDLTDGLVLTGYSTNGTWQSFPRISSLWNLIKEDQPDRFANTSSGYLTWNGPGGNQFWFFHYPNFDYSQLEQAEATKWPYTVGEQLTAGFIAAPATEYTKPTLLLAGQFDIIFCGGDCTGILEQAAPFFPKASVLETYRQPDTGHGLNLHYNSTAFYSRDRIYTGDQTSNTITVIDPGTNTVLGTISLGGERLGGDLGPQYLESVNSHGLGFSRDGKYIVSLSVLSNTVMVVRTSDNAIVSKTYLDRGPHEAFFAPDNRTVWIGTRGVSSVDIIDGLNGTFLDRIFTAAGPSKVLFSANGTIAYVNHIFDAIFSVIDVPSRTVMYNITGLADIFSSDMMISANDETLWAAHKLVGKVSVIDLAARKVNTILDTGTETNRPNFAIINGTNYGFVTVASLNATRVYRQARAEDTPVLVKTIPNTGIQPHPLWPSPGNTRMYVANQHSDSTDVIDTNSLEVINSFNASQDTQSLIYVSRVIPEDNNGIDLLNLGTQGLGLRVENRLIPVNTTNANINTTILPSPLGNEPQALVTIRETQGLDMFQIIGRDLIVNGTYTASAVCLTCTEEQRTPLLSFKASSLTNKMPGCSGNEEVLGFLKFFESYRIDSIKIEEGEGKFGGQ